MDIVKTLIYNIFTKLDEGDKFVDRNYCAFFNCFISYFYNDCFNGWNSAYYKRNNKKEKTEISK